MLHVELEKRLNLRMKKRRIILACFSSLFLIITVVFSVLYSGSRTVEEIDYFFGVMQNITYNYNYAWGILVGVIGLVWCFGFFLSDILFCKLCTIEVNSSFVTYYRGLSKNELYINGEYRDGCLLYGYYLEATLPDLTKVMVSIGKWSARISFSNGHPSVEI